MGDGETGRTPTFRALDELDLHELLSGGLPAHDVEADNGACLLEGFHCSRVGHLPHIHFIYKQDAIVDPGGSKAGLSQELPAARALPFQGTGTLTPVSSPHLRRPSWAAAPPGMILVMKMDGSSPMCGLSVPPAILKPRPELPWAEGGEERQPSSLPAPGKVTGQGGGGIGEPCPEQEGQG